MTKAIMHYNTNEEPREVNAQTALILVDIQNDYFEGGRNPLVGAKQALEQALKVRQAFRDKGYLVIHVQHVSLKEGASFFLPDTEGCEIHPSLKPYPDEPLVIKHAPDSFHQTNLRDVLEAHHIEKLVFAGMMTHHCIDTSVRRASHDYPCLLISDACATKDLTYEGQIIEAQVVQKTFLAGLQGFSKVIRSHDLLALI